MGTDVRFGGGESIVRDGDYIYFSTTLDHSSYIYRIDVNGKIESIIGTKAPKRRVKVEKKDKGLIERTENSTILLTEDNKMVLTD